MNLLRLLILAATPMRKQRQRDARQEDLRRRIVEMDLMLPVEDVIQAVWL